MISTDFGAEDRENRRSSSGAQRSLRPMRYRLQYFYSIIIFFGVLACSYFMVSRETGPAIPFRTIEAPPLRAEASPLDPGVSQLFEAEKAIAKVKKEPTPS